jgi:hypothetical protein
MKQKRQGSTLPKKLPRSGSVQLRVVLNSSKFNIMRSNLENLKIQPFNQTLIPEGGGLEAWLNVQIKQGRIKLKHLHASQKNLDPRMLLWDVCI